MVRHRKPLERIRRIRLRNIRCFEHVDIDFCDGDTRNPVPWTLILGDNSTGKSTLLQAIALGLASPKEAQGLFEMDNRHEWLRHGADEGEIKVELCRDPDKPPTLRTHILRENYGERIVRVTDGPPRGLGPGESVDLYPEPPFLCGYGAARRSFATESPRRYTLRDAVETLFDPDASLQNPELSLRRQSRVAEDDLLGLIDRLLNLPKGSTRLDIEGLEVRGPWGTFLPVNALSDGYRATLAWILDMLGWVLLHDPEKLHEQLEGIVLIDEVEQHLHPSWQRRIIGLLRRQFPGLQFVVTTHAPLCVTGATDLDDSEVNFVHLRWEGESVEATDRLKPPRGQRADQILTSYLFGLETTSDNRTKQKVQRLSQLLARGRKVSDVERLEIQRLREDLQNEIGTEETALGRESSDLVEQAIDGALRESVRRQISRVQPSNPTTDPGSKDRVSLSSPHLQRSRELPDRPPKSGQSVRSSEVREQEVSRVLGHLPLEPPPEAEAPESLDPDLPGNEDDESSTMTAATVAELEVRRQLKELLND